MPCHKYTYYDIFYSFRERKKPMTIFFFSRIPDDKELREVEKDQINSLLAAVIIYNFFGNNLHRSKGMYSRFYYKEMVIWHKKMK